MGFCFRRRIICLLLKNNMRKKNILICDVNTPFVYGGSNLHVNNLYENLILSGFNVDVIKFPFIDNTSDDILVNSMTWRFLNLDFYLYSKIDLVIPLKFPSYYVKSSNKVCWLMHQYRRAYDTSLHKTEDDLDAYDEIKKMDNRAFSECKKIYTNSQNVADRLKKYNGIDGQALYHPPKLAEDLYFDSIGDYFFVISRLEIHKRIDLIIKAMVYTDKKVKLLIAGTGLEENSLKKLVSDLKLTNRVKFLGFISDKELIEHYSKCKAVIFTPYDEDYGYITLESFLSKKVVITAEDSGGPLEFIENDVNGFIVKPEEEKLAAIINKVNRMSELELKDMGAKGGDSVKDINWKSVVNRFTEFL